MADALVSFVVQELHAMAKDEVTLIISAKQEVRKLSSMFTAIQAILEDAEKQQVTKKAVQDWLGKLKEVAYEVMDILDEWRTDAFKLEGDEYDIRVCYKVPSCFLFPCLSFKKVELRHDIGRRIKEVMERLNQISMEKNDFSFNVADSISQTKERQTGSLIDESEIFGRGHDKESIIRKLVCETTREEKSVTIVSIVGMGGLGKTTLAQLVYNDERVKAHFERRIWICVSDDFDVNRIATKVIQSMGGATHGSPDFDTLQNSLHEVVGKTRFLLVLDDVWNKNDTKWKKLRVPLKSAAQGSRIVVTTRSRKVADVMETTHMHSLDILSDPDSWKLFTSRAFKGRAEEECLELTNIGKGIVDKCKGIPLAVQAVGSLMYFKRTKLEWQFALESETWEWDLPEDEGILPALLLSYYSLPLHLKQCFSFCSVFPKDHVIKKDELVKLWMAHGIIRSERLEVEEIGEKYFDDLLAHSLFQDAEKDDDGNIVECKMHDLVHDLAKFVTGDYCITKIGNSGACSDRTHHLSLLVNYDVSSIPSSTLCNAKRLHTFLLFGWSRIDGVHDSLFKYMRFLRALDLSKTFIENFSSLIGRLKHLRYLSLCDSHIIELPEFVTDLCNLQTLKLNGCRRLCKLPSGISKMVKLRHLEIESTPDLKFLPHGLGNLTSLRTLCMFFVGTENTGCKIKELKCLNLLRGNLEIHNLERVMDGDEAREAELDKKHYLRSLSLHCECKIDEKWRTLGGDEMERMESVFDALRPPHSNLKQLKILFYAGSKFPSWLEESIFSSLVEVELLNCKKCRLLPGLGKLRSLKYLTIGGADAVNVVGVEFYGNYDEKVRGRVFPKLERLEFYSMTNWEEWKLRPKNGEVMPSLRELLIENCRKLKALPDHLPITLRKVDIINCDEMIWTPCHPPPLVEDLYLSGNVLGILSRPLPCLPALKTLEIREILILKSLPSDGWELLESLHTLHIRCCPELASLPDELGQLKALQTLVIINCYQLPSLPNKLGQLEALHNLKIHCCKGLTSLVTGLGQFKALQTLYISTCTKLRCLSDGLVQLKALRTVHISSCSELQFLFEGFEQLKALRSLNVSDCQKLRPLPELQHLTTLEELKIARCPLVTEQFKKEKGEDWCNISHIPCVVIDHKKIQ